MYLTPAQIKGKIKNLAKKKWYRSNCFVENIYDGTFSGANKVFKV